jgi:glycosyltransferase involved in cell wall biosynthesis
VIHNGIDLEEFDRLAEDAPPRDDIPRIGIVGQMRRDRQKGYPGIIEAARCIPDARFCFCGDGHGRPEIEALVHRARLEDRITLVGERRDVPAFLRTLDIYIQPSRWEGFPHAILEAMAAGLPVVATRVGGIPEMVEDGVTGIIIPRDQVRALAEAIRFLLDDPRRARQMGKAGRSRVEKHFTVSANIAAHRDLYLKLVEKDRGGRRPPAASRSPGRAGPRGDGCDRPSGNGAPR